jgi:hypothetical protein
LSHEVLFAAIPRDCPTSIERARYYGTTTAVGGYGDLYLDGAQLVDIFDFVAISKHFGPVDP